tara:strand:- start:14 stop:193 length:180 start_codon:yes stop_codon:yes gene_type:complete
MLLLNMILDLLNGIANSDKFHLKSNERIKGLFKILNNFKDINFLINRYIFKNKYSKTIF